MTEQMYRQGDVLLVQTDELPADSSPVEWTDRVVLAYGEETGHAHAINISQTKMFEAGGTRYIVVAKDGAELKHEEHSTINLKQGVYRIVHQREYSPDRERLVID